MISAIVLAAGLSERMGCLKLALPWGESSVLGTVIGTLIESGVDEIVVVTGHRAAEVQGAVPKHLTSGVRFVHNPDYTNSGMLGSIKIGLQSLPASTDAALLCLGDHPQLTVTAIRAVLAAGAAQGWRRVVVPSYQKRAGHPIVIPRHLWPEVLATHESLRQVLRSRTSATDFVVVDSPSILADLDTPDDYKRSRLSRKEP